MRFPHNIHLKSLFWNVTDTRTPTSTILNTHSSIVTEFTPHNPPQSSDFELANNCASSKQWNDIKVCFPYCVANNPSEILCTVRILNIGEKRSLIFGDSSDTSIPFAHIVTDQGLSYESRNATIGGIKSTYIPDAPYNSSYNVAYLFEPTAATDKRISPSYSALSGDSGGNA
jgi:hypothetical protein